MSKPTRVLMLEDLNTDAELVEREVRKALPACELKRIQTREEFTEALEVFYPDIILSDYKLPHFDGMTALKLARERVPEIPFILVTGSMNEETAVECLRAGAWDYIIKEHIKRLGPAILGGLEQKRIRLEKQSAEESLRESEDRFRSLVETAPEGIFVQSGGKFVFVNQTMQRLLGASKQEELLEKDFMAFIAPEYHKVVNERIKAQKDTGKIAPSMDQEYIRLDGKRVPVETTAVQFRYKQLEAHLVFVRDITKRKMAEESLRESEKKYRELAENINEAIFTIDILGVFTYVSPPIKAITGYSQAEILGRNFVEFVHPEDLPSLKNSFQNTIEGRFEPWEFRYRTKDNRIRWARTSSVTIVEEGNIVGLRGVLSDVTEHRIVEDEMIKAHKLESLGLLAGGIAHDFNNILTGIRGNISMVRMSLPKEDQNAEILKEAENAVFQAKNLTQQLLTFSKGGVPVKNLTALTGLIKDSVTFAVRGSNVKCEFDFDKGLHIVQADAGQITQVINNIVINAVQAMPDGGSLSVSGRNVSYREGWHNTYKAGEYVEIKVSDTGPGIPDKYLQKIFDPYFTTKEHGNGLGLATSYSIIKKHDGYLKAESEVGKGTTIYILLPAFDGKAEEKNRAKDQNVKMGSGRILVLDDEQVICSVMKRILNKLGYEAECLGNSDQVIERYRQTYNTAEAFDAVILDLTVPGGKGGKAAIVGLREINPAIKAVVSSGYSNDPLISNYREYGFSEVLPKPFNIEEVSVILHNLLAGDPPKKSAG